MPYINGFVSTKRIWIISDTHSLHHSLKVPEEIDIVIHGGDCSNWRDPARNSVEVNDFMDWFSKLPIPIKIYVPGNHDTSIEAGMIVVPDNIIMLINQAVTIEGIHIYGSPVTPAFGHGWAYNVKRLSDQMKYHWDNIPDDTDILITHSPPKNVLDLVEYEHAGCELLGIRVQEINPKLHIFGHIHEQRGEIYLSRYGRTLFLNATVVWYTASRRDYMLVNNGFIVNFEIIDERE